jgi:hypothetical protein
VNNEKEVVKQFTDALASLGMRYKKESNLFRIWAFCSEETISGLVLGKSRWVGQYNVVFFAHLKEIDCGVEPFEFHKMHARFTFNGQIADESKVLLNLDSTTISGNERASKVFDFLREQVLPVLIKIRSARGLIETLHDEVSFTRGLVQAKAKASLLICD